MDELEFRRRLFADPTDPDVRDAATQNPDWQALLDDTLQFERALHATLEVPIPNGLAERIISHTEQQSHDTSSTPITNEHVVVAHKFRRHFGPFAMAASILLASLVYFLSSSPTAVHANEYAFEHVYHELKAFELEDEVPLQTVNEKLATLGAKLEYLPGKVTYATFCNYLGKRSLHLIYQSDSGPVTVFVVPRKESFQETSRQFFDERFSGLINPLEKADLILVANLNTPIEHFADRFTTHMTWL
ncbi:hypothetical protein PALB_34150 [Pseudoalteromonas luteoviolacea B = ATCC 29581]|nr:hypothetical protein PALB_34150 [Pseudoalteromonas luteoviolacea B = ATCC 29581]